MAKYDPKSAKAEEFINHEEILDTLRYAAEHKSDRKLIERLLARAVDCKGLTHREAAVLLECDQPDLNEKMFHLARQIKEELYGQRIVLFAPLYLSNYCINSCVYCPYHVRNKHIRRVKLTQEEIRREVIALQDMGHKRLALETGEDPVNNPIEYVLESIQTIYSIKHKNGAIRRVNVNIAATTVDNYRKLKEVGIGTYILFQETYHRENYEKLHPAGPKHDYAWHTEAMDRAMEGGIDDVGSEQQRVELLLEGVEEIEAVVELVVSDVDRVVAHDVERRRKRVNQVPGPGFVPGEEGAQGISLDGVAVVHQHHALRPTLGSDAFDDGGQLGQPGFRLTGPGLVAIVVPVQGGAVDVRGGQQRESRHLGSFIQGRSEPIASVG